MQKSSRLLLSRLLQEEEKDKKRKNSEDKDIQNILIFKNLFPFNKLS